LNTAFADNPDDTLIWNQVYFTIIESTPPSRPIASPLEQTPYTHKTSILVNSSELRQNIDKVLKLELGPLYVELDQFYETFFGSVVGLEEVSSAIFEKCMEGSEPLYSEGWTGWPKDANQNDVLTWFEGLNEKLAVFAKDLGWALKHRRPLAQPDEPIESSI
jgi:hypothetical protein